MVLKVVPLKEDCRVVYLDHTSMQHGHTACNFITIGVSSDFKVCEIWQIGNLLQLLNLVQTQLWVEVEEQTAIQNAQILLA